MSIKPLAARKHVRGPADGNSGVRFQDSTAKVSGVMLGGKVAQKSGKRLGGCSSCSK